MSETQEENKTQVENETQIKKKVFLFIHNDGINEKNLEPLLLIDNERIYMVMLKRKWNTIMYYIFRNRKYLKLWNDKKDNILLYFDNWSGDLFVRKKQTEEYIDTFNYVVSSYGLICEDKNGQRKKIVLEGFDVIELAIKQFLEHDKAIFYVLCNKLS